MSDVIAGRIELVDPLARGATGSLWRAVDRRYGAICAAKVMRHRDGADVLRFVREQSVGTAQGLGTHPHLLPPYTWVAEDDTIVLVMPLVHGGTVASLLREHGTLSPSLSAVLLRQLLEALAAMHENHWVHRDVKPANLLLDATGEGAPHLMLADFGIALHETDVRLTATGRFHGTPGYMAPEVQEGQTTGPAQDVWAAAVCAQQMLGGEDTRPSALIGADPVMASLQSLLSAMLADDPAQRPTAREAARSLPAPEGPVESWCRSLAGERILIPDAIDPLDAGSVGHGLPEVGLDGPVGLVEPAPGLHARITARSATSPSSAPALSPAEVSTEAFVDEPTRVNPGAQPLPGDRPAPGRRGTGAGLALLGVSALTGTAAVVLAVLALG